MRVDGGKTGGGEKKRDRAAEVEPGNHCQHEREREKKKNRSHNDLKKGNRRKQSRQQQTLHRSDPVSCVSICFPSSEAQNPEMTGNINACKLNPIKTPNQMTPKTPFLMILLFCSPSILNPLLLSCPISGETQGHVSV